MDIDVGIDTLQNKTYGEGKVTKKSGKHHLAMGQLHVAHARQPKGKKC